MYRFEAPCPLAPRPTAPVSARTGVFFCISCLNSGGTRDAVCLGPMGRLGPPHLLGPWVGRSVVAAWPLCRSPAGRQAIPIPLFSRTITAEEEEVGSRRARANYSGQTAILTDRAPKPRRL